MNLIPHPHMYFFGAAVLAFLYLNSQGSAAAQSVPVLSYPFNLGYNLANGTFGVSTPV